MSAALGITLAELFAGIDGGEEPTQASRKASAKDAELDRNRLLLELETAERSIRAAKAIATPLSTTTRNRVPSKLHKP